MRLIILLFAKYFLLALVLAGTDSSLHWNRALFEGFTALDDNVASNFPALCSAGVPNLDVELASTFLATSLIQ